MTMPLTGLSAGTTAYLNAAQGIGAGKKQDLGKVAQDFEAVFLEHYVQRMFEGLGEDGPLGTGGAGGDAWRSMLASEHAKSISKAGGIGLARDVHRELLRLQERAGGTS